MRGYNALDYNTIQDIIKYQNDLAELLSIIDQLAKDKYDLGFNDGYDVDNIDGWGECHDQTGKED